MKPVVVVTGLTREAEVLPGHGIEVLACGGAADRLARALDGLAPGAAGIVSFGMAGALDPQLRIGEWVIGDRLLGAFEWTCDPPWVAALAARLPNARTGAVYCNGLLIADRAEKLRLGVSSGAVVADMESRIAAEAASRARIPFVILRCISDEAGDDLPPAIKVAMRSDGKLALGAILASIVTHPGQVSAIIRVLTRFSCAYSALKAGAITAGPRLAFDRR